LKTNEKKAIRVLILADNQKDAELLQSYIKGFREYIVENEHVINLPQALYMLHRGPFGLILLVDRPDSDINIRETLEGFRECRIAVPVVVIYSQGSKQPATELTKMGVCDCIVQENLSSILLETTISGVAENFQQP
jgi:DNA-binding NtrC family response regulator